MGIGLEMGDCGRLSVYLAELMKWNRRVNLVARDTPERQAIDCHFLDSLTLLPLLQESDDPVHLLDVGTGAGFPGLVLACVLPGASFTLVEVRQKRVSYLRHLIRTLGLANVEVVADRIEPHAAAWHGRFTHVTSRAVAEPGVFLPLIRPLVTPATRVILMLAGREALVSIERFPAGPWRLAGTRDFVLPFSEAPRLLAVVHSG
jgi:16S rRNA (guanine(527)-N(7))-methyltransferase GidB